MCAGIGSSSDGTSRRTRELFEAKKLAGPGALWHTVMRRLPTEYKEDSVQMKNAGQSALQPKTPQLSYEAGCIVTYGSITPCALNCR